MSDSESGAEARAATPLRILAVSLRWPPYLGGGYEMSSAEAVAELRGLGHRVIVLTARGNRLRATDDLLPRLEPSLDSVDPMGDARRAGTLTNWRRHVSDHHNLELCSATIDAVRPDVVLYFNLALLSLAPLIAAKRAKLPTIGQINDEWPSIHWLREWRERGNKRRRRKFIESQVRRVQRKAEFGTMWSPSQSLSKRLYVSGFLPNQLETHPLPLPPEARAAAVDAEPRERAAGEPLRLVCTSMWWEGKGQHILLDALRDVVASGAKVELALFGGGSGDYERRIKRMAADASLKGAVRVAGMSSRDEVLEGLRQAHAFVFPSVWSEPFGLATLEAMAMGTAVIASDAGATPEIARDGKEALLTPAGDSNALAQAILELERDDRRRLELAHAARRRALDDFNASDYYARLSRALMDAASRRRT